MAAARRVVTMADADPILFFSEFASPYAYIAANLIEDLAARHGRDVRWLPVSLGHVWETLGFQREAQLKEKAAYNRRDWRRFAELEGIALVKPKVFPCDARLARLVFYRLAARDEGLSKRFALAVFHRYWGEGEEITAPEHLAGILAGLKARQEEATLAAEDAGAKQALIAAGELAISHGMFGAPFFVVDGEPFFGADRIPHMDRWLARRGEGR